jgi:two-component system sensor histidine kinase MprB
MRPLSLAVRVLDRRLSRLRGLSFRARIVLGSALAVAIAVVLASLVVYVIVRGNLVSELGHRLRQQAERAADLPDIVMATSRPGRFLVRLPPPAFGGEGMVSLLTADGQAFSRAPVAIPVSGQAKAVAAGRQGAYFSDTHIGGTHVRIYTAPLAPGLAIRVVRPLTEVDSEVHTIGLALIFISLAGIATAALPGLAVARTSLKPVRELTATAERVTTTGDLRERIAARGRDELARLASTFNAMLAKLDQAAQAQRQLVSDASHELRTPLTSLRTNLEVVLRRGSLSEPEKELVSDAVEQVSEMTVLIEELAELARGDSELEGREDVRLDLIVSGAAERTQRDFPSIRFEVELDPTVVHGAAKSLDRTVRNLLDNAAKWNQPDEPVTVKLHDGELTVRDHGPGIAEADLPHVFERFYRAAASRSQPGSGLGLAIVRQVVDAHGGTVSVERAVGSGTLVQIKIAPVSELPLTDP